MQFQMFNKAVNKNLPRFCLKTPNWKMNVKLKKTTSQALFYSVSWSFTTITFSVSLFNKHFSISFIRFSLLNIIVFVFVCLYSYFRLVSTSDHQTIDISVVNAKSLVVELHGFCSKTIKVALYK